MTENIELRHGKNCLDSNTQKITPHIKLESDGWIDLTQIDPDWWTDPISLRILGFLFPERSHTKTQITVKLKLWEQQVSEMLERLGREGFIYGERVFFGGRIIHIYQLTELGRFFLHQMDTQFPGIFLQ